MPLFFSSRLPLISAGLPLILKWLPAYYCEYSLICHSNQQVSSWLTQACNLRHGFLNNLKSIWASKYKFFEIKIFENSDFAACAKFSVSKITSYTVVFGSPKNNVALQSWNSSTDSSQQHAKLHSKEWTLLMCASVLSTYIRLLHLSILAM